MKQYEISLNPECFQVTESFFDMSKIGRVEAVEIKLVGTLSGIRVERWFNAIVGIPLGENTKPNLVERALL